jgi:hypothetical protein
MLGPATKFHSFLTSTLDYASAALPGGMNRFFFNNIPKQKHFVTLISSHTKRSGSRLGCRRSNERYISVR